LTDQTRGIINKDKINLMKNGVKIMNFARGELVNNADMAEALESGKVFRYVTDFPNEDTLKMKNAICIPHLGASTEESEVNCVAMAADQLVEFFERGNIINSVNFPNMEMDISGGMRIVVANKNIPNMVSQISAILAHESLNILDMINKNKGEIAYNIIDVDKHKLHSDVISRIKQIDGVFMARAMKNSF
jgi:D-3-phosphoglycerate dehydrogenase / 2-oxoglutarate reductase